MTAQQFQDNKEYTLLKCKWWVFWPQWLSYSREYIAIPERGFNYK